MFFFCIVILDIRKQNHSIHNCKHPFLKPVILSLYSKLYKYNFLSTVSFKECMQISAQWPQSIHFYYSFTVLDT